MTETDISVLMWAWFAAELVIGLALAGAGGTIVRRANPASGYVMIFAGATMALAACCYRGYSLATSDPDSSLAEIVPYRFILVTEVSQFMITWLAIAVALALLAGKLKAKFPLPLAGGG